jgi:hypothetical protein
MRCVTCRVRVCRFNADGGERTMSSGLFENKTLANHDSLNFPKKTHDSLNSLYLLFKKKLTVYNF